MRAFASCFASVALVLAPQPAYADDLTTIQGWNILDNGTSCSLSMEYDGPGSTQLMLLVEPGESSAFHINNSQWKSIEDQKVYELEVWFDAIGYNLPGQGAKGEGDLQPGFTFFLNEKSTERLLALLAGAKGLSFEIGDVLVDSLSLAGSAAAIAGLRKCVANVERSIAKAEADRKAYEQRWRHLEGDPFANPAKANEGALIFP